MDKLTAMATFVKVVQTGSFTRAAVALGLPNARISQRITDLERVLGVRLLNRTTRAQSLTEDGHIYFGKCLVILEAIEELEGSLSTDPAHFSGKVRVETLRSVAHWIIAPRLEAFYQRHPNIALSLRSSDRISNLAEEGIDCAIRGGHLEDSEMVARHVCDVKLGLYAAPQYLEEYGPIATAEDLANTRKISWFNAKGTWRLLSKKDAMDVKARECMQFDDPEIAIQSCLAGSGVCPGAPFAVQSYVQAGTLVPILAQWHFTPRPIHIVYPTKKHLSTRVRNFAEWAFEVMQSDQGLHLAPQDLA
ncbi:MULTISPECIES: LysR family transcriptional regulator [Pseudomonas]|uniref:LysR family transcriptional regulator n=1 Tax=Pseudomonas TaxID=286 RepID=UPI000C070D8D|nr:MULTISPECIES: LysR family transcriptional regulator [Pseudomonas]MBH3424906.1 LysR family transcriptional regulator [Pseudomonas gessardii]NNA70525.1 LysR family transcriptional regulator [Pseudomonas gessardii]PHN61108.1 LysR family transcriptional regulator [Pseudomonas sp. ICMP 8385]